jgi:hypothetical protein
MWAEAVFEAAAILFVSAFIDSCLELIKSIVCEATDGLISYRNLFRKI